jgi:hypothetical protein
MSIPHHGYIRADTFLETWLYIYFVHGIETTQPFHPIGLVPMGIIETTETSGSWKMFAIIPQDPAEVRVGSLICTHLHVKDWNRCTGCP